ncbi:Clo7bot family Cys-rich peptide [Gottschalkia purinilytica]|nr:Clo7bot family Cys-rich peptide [Gottschalkia purinilytica]
MKYVVKPSKSFTEGYCFSCTSQCQNNCGGQCATQGK